MSFGFTGVAAFYKVWFLKKTQEIKEVQTERRSTDCGNFISLKKT